MKNKIIVENRKENMSSYIVTSDQYKIQKSINKSHYVCKNKTLTPHNTFP